MTNVNKLDDLDRAMIDLKQIPNVGEIWVDSEGREIEIVTVSADNKYIDYRQKSQDELMQEGDEGIVISVGGCATIGVFLFKYSIKQ